MESVNDEVSGSFLLSSTSASDSSSCTELSGKQFTSNGGEGQTKLLRASLLDERMEEVGCG